MVPDPTSYSGTYALSTYFIGSERHRLPWSSSQKADSRIGRPLSRQSPSTSRRAPSGPPSCTSNGTSSLPGQLYIAGGSGSTLKVMMTSSRVARMPGGSTRPVTPPLHPARVTRAVILVAFDDTLEGPTIHAASAPSGVGTSPMYDDQEPVAGSGIPGSSVAAPNAATARAPSNANPALVRPTPKDCPQREPCVRSALSARMCSADHGRESNPPKPSAERTAA
jgi:hypothetical protein